MSHRRMVSIASSMMPIDCIDGFQLGRIARRGRRRNLQHCVELDASPRR